MSSTLPCAPERIQVALATSTLRLRLKYRLIAKYWTGLS
jgi:hypothetical protein